LGTWIIFCVPAVAGEAPDAPKPKVAGAEDPGDEGPGNGGSVREVRPITFYVKDKDGKLLPVIDMTYEAISRLYRLDLKLAIPDRPPRYVLEKFSSTGSAEKGWAALEAKLDIRVRDRNWVRVPLRMNRAVLRDPVVYEGDGKHFITYDRDGDGYVGWIQGGTGKPHTLTMKMLVPLQTVGRETRLPLSVPSAAVSELTFEARVHQAVGRVSDGATLLDTKPLEKGRTQLIVQGLRGDFRLAWHPRDAQPTETPVTRDATGNLLVRIAGQHSIRTEASFKVRSFGGPVGSFRVRLPPEAKLISGKGPGCTVTTIQEKDVSPSKADRSLLVEVAPQDSEANSVEFRLVTERAAKAVGPGQLVEVARFDVNGAVQQSGFIAVVVTGESLVDWTEGDGVVRVDELPASLRRDSVAAAFEYFRQPCSLKLSVLPKKTRVSVEPLYLMLVGASDVQLEARLKYRIRGAKTDRLYVDLPGWELDSVEPASIVKVDAVVPERVSPLAVPLAKASTGEFEIRLKARRSIEPGTMVLSAPVPRPQATTLSTATVVVLADDNVQLKPRAAELQGLSPERVPPQIELPPRQQDPNYYRDLGDVPQSTFVADFEVRKRNVAVTIANQVKLDAREASVEQRLSYRIAHESLDRLVLTVPASLSSPDRLTVLFDGQTLAPTALGGSGQDAVAMQVALPSPQIGTCELVLRYRIDMPELETSESSTVSVPFVMPNGRDSSTPEGSEAAVITSNALRVVAAETVSANPIAGDWTLEEPGEPGEAKSEWSLTAEDAAEEIRFDMMLAEPLRQGATVIDKGWIQTFLTGSSRQDRATFRLVTGERQIQVQLPSGVAPDEVDVLLDGRRVIPRSNDERELYIDLPGDGPRRRHLLELWYPFSKVPSRRGPLTLQMPRVVGSSWVRKVYWQLIMPRNEHVVALPDNVTAESTWGWRGMYWGRQPKLNQRQLEEWIGIESAGPASEDEPPYSAANQYLFSTFGRVEALPVRTVGRGMIVLAASGAALVAGLLLIYVPVVRRPVVLLVVSVVLAGAVVLWTGPALLVTQAAVLGFVLALIARLLEWSMVRRRLGRSVVHGTAVAGQDRSTTEARVLVPESSSQAIKTTATMVSEPPPEEELT